MDPIVAVVLAIFTLGIGLFLGWFVGRAKASVEHDQVSLALYT